MDTCSPPRKVSNYGSTPDEEIPTTIAPQETMINNNDRVAPLTPASSVATLPEERSELMVTRTELGYVCGECGRVFARKNDAERHTSNVHSKERPYECGLCVKNFPRSDHRLNHWKNVHKWKGPGIKQPKVSPKKIKKRRVKN